MERRRDIEYKGYVHVQINILISRAWHEILPVSLEGLLDHDPVVWLRFLYAKNIEGKRRKDKRRKIIGK